MISAESSSNILIEVLKLKKRVDQLEAENQNSDNVNNQIEFTEEDKDETVQIAVAEFNKLINNQ